MPSGYIKDGFFLLTLGKGSLLPGLSFSSSDSYVCCSTGDDPSGSTGDDPSGSTGNAQDNSTNTPADPSVVNRSSDSGSVSSDSSSGPGKDIRVAAKELGKRFERDPRGLQEFEEDGKDEISR